MPGSSGKRRSARKREPTSRSRSSAAANNDSPSRSAKRRKTTAAAPPRPLPEQDPVEDRTEEDSSDNEADSTPTDTADQIVPYLKEAEHAVAVAEKHMNKSIQDHGTIEAYAKIAGRTWTYFVTKPTINIGRASDQKTSTDSRASEAEEAHIDLGPHKLVSRIHATIFYNADDERWHLRVHGRNGVRINNELYRKGSDARLISGDVLLVADTEMIFISPGVPIEIKPEYMGRLDRPQIKAEDAPRSIGLSHALNPPPQYQEPTHISPYAQPDGNAPSSSSATADVSVQRQSTPIKNILQAPYFAQNQEQPLSRTPQRQAAIILDNNDHQMDYSSDAVKHVKPPMSYATLIGQAILSTPEEKLSLNGIYEWIKSHFSYYRHIEQGWQNSIRHNLSLNTSFQRVDRDTHAPGKGGLWYIVPDKVEEHRKGGLKITSRGGARQSSNPSSPAPKRSPKKKTPPKPTSPIPQTSPLAAPLAPNPFQHDIQTPSRAPRASALAHVETQTLPQLSDDASPLPTRSGPYNAQHTGRSPPTLSSTALFDENNSFSTVTPAPRRIEHQITAPSTQKLPSMYLPQSSPAPFWKVGAATPARLPDTSPIKDGNDALPLESSSPPPPLANGSPTRARSTPDNRLAEARSNGTSVAPPRLKEATPPARNDNDDDDDGAPIDLMGGSFKKIGEKQVSTS